MSTDKEKIFVIYVKLLNLVEDNYKVLNVCNCLIEVLEELSSSPNMIQFVVDINNKSSNMATSLQAVLNSLTSPKLNTLYNFVQLL